MAGGRPTKMTPSTVNKLEEAFLLGCNDEEACLFADISKQTLYNYQYKNPEFIDRKECLKSNPVMKARKVIIDALTNNDIATAHKVIDRREGSKVAINHSGEVKNSSIDEIIAERLELEREIAAIREKEA